MSETVKQIIEGPKNYRMLFASKRSEKGYWLEEVHLWAWIEDNYTASNGVEKAYTSVEPLGLYCESGFERVVNGAGFICIVPPDWTEEEIQKAYEESVGVAK